MMETRKLINKYLAEMNCEIHVLSQSAFGMDHFVLREEVWSLDIVKIERSEKSEEKIA